MATTINSNITDGLVITPDTSGEIELQANGVTKAKVTANGLQDANGNSITGGMYRNLIINGDMRIDQRNAGASVTQNIGAGFVSDRFYNLGTVASKFTSQQVTDAPEGFNYSIKNTSSSSYTVGSAEQFWITQKIEGYNIAHLDWGTANAKTVTLSFWVKSSLTGTFGGSLTDISRSYPFSYTISSANTWEKKTITIAGDTSGTWTVNNGTGVGVYFSLGSGSNYQNTSGSWYSGNYKTVSGATSVVGTSGATFYITGVQLEVGSGSSDFEHLPYDVQLARCQRYYEKSYEIETAPGTASQPGMSVGYWSGAAGTNIKFWIPFKVTKRTSPTLYAWDYAGNQSKCSAWNSAAARTDNLSTGSRAFPQLCSQSMSFNEANLGSYASFGTHWVVDAEL